MVISSFNPLHAITKRGHFSANGQLRNGLVIVQFTLSALLIMSAIVLQRQLSYIDGLTTGYHARRAATANPAQKLRSE